MMKSSSISIFNKLGKSFFTFACLLLPVLASGQKKISHTTESALAKNLQSALLRGPYLQATTSNSIVIRWRTEALSRSRVRYGTDVNNLSQVADVSELATEHIVKLTGLAPHTRYFYSVGAIKDTLQIGPENYFYTLPVTGTISTYRIGLFGDCGTNTVMQHNARDQFVKYLNGTYMDAWLLLGDNAYLDGTDVQYQSAFFNSYKDLLKKYPLFPAPGNHDYHDLEYSDAEAQVSRQVAYFKNFTVPMDGESGGLPSHNPAYYSFDIGNIHFISLDSQGKDNQLHLYDPNSPQVQWLEKDLEANHNKGWVIAYWHHPPYTKGNHDSDKDGDLVKVRKNLLPVLEKYKVDLLICGHSHLYERSKPMLGYYGKAADFNAAKYVINTSSGKYDGSPNSGPYVNDLKKDAGIVYVVTGSSSKVGEPSKDYPHTAMYYSNIKDVGASILQVTGNRLDFKWVCADGVIRDQFTMMKDVGKTANIDAKAGKAIKLTASFIGDYKWDTGQTTQTIEVIPKTGTNTYKVKDKYSYITDVFVVKGT